MKYPGIFVVLLAAAGLTAAEYHLSPDGSDAAAGSRQAPWRTIAKANAALMPGDTVIFLPGRYEGNIAPKRSGAPDAPITYKAEKTGGAILTGGNEQKFAAWIHGRSHIILDGFRFEVKPGTGWLSVSEAEHCIFRNLDMEHSTIANPIGCSNSRFCRFENIRAVRCNSAAANGVLSGDMWNNYNITNCVFEKLYLSRVGHRPFGLWFDCEKIVVRDSVFDCRWGRNFEFFSPRQVLMERCVVTNAFEGSGSFDGLAKLFVFDSIFRNNLIIRNGYAPISLGSYQYQDMPPFGVLNSRFYNNTWFRNQDYGVSLGDNGRDPKPHMNRNNVLKNNIMVDNNQETGTAIKISDSIAKDNLFRHNLLRGSGDGAKTVFINAFTEVFAYTADESNQARPQQFAGNFDADPRFHNADQDDYTLQADSPAVDRGEALTVATANGPSIWLPVADARYFYDGYRIPGEKGDLIVVGEQKTPARVVRADVEQNILTLDQSIAFKTGDRVSLPYAGQATDLGAYEFGHPATGPQFDPAAIRQPAPAGGVLLRSDFEVNDQEDWFHLWNFTRQPLSYAGLDSTTAAGGKSSWKVYYVPDEEIARTGLNARRSAQGGSTLSTHLSPAWWEIDRFPLVSFSYRIPKGVPVGVCFFGESRATVPGPKSIFLAGSPALKTGAWSYHPAYALIDDGEWHAITIDVRKAREVAPGLKNIYLLRFWAAGPNGKPGDCYWLDDVVIGPAAEPATGSR